MTLSEYLNSKIAYLEAKINPQIRQILIDVGDQTVKKIREYLLKWYGDYEPKDYKRTYELLNCVRYSIDGNRVNVIFDYRRLRGIQENDGKGWQAHRSFDGEDFTKGLVDFLENGSNFGLGSPHNPRRNDFGTHMLEKTQEWVNQYVQEEVQRRINVVIREAQGK